jgi:imidazolonepropionase-like amidohydrolase
MSTAEFQGAYAKALQLAGMLHKDDIQLVAGTDFSALGGLALPRELELLDEAGLPAADVLRIATLDAARVMHRDQDFGSIAPGKQADLILVRGDPTADITHIRDLRLTIKGGVPYRPADLLAASGVPH